MKPFIWVAAASALASGFFALTGFALRTFRRVELEQAFAGPAGKARLALLERNEWALGLTAALCRAVSNLLLVVTMVYLFDAVRGGWPRAVGAMALAAGIIAIFGVAIPYAWARHAGEKVLAATLPVLMFFRYALFPVVAFMQAFEVPVRRLAGVAEPTGEEESAKQEILQAASEGAAEGAVEPEEAEMIASVIEFGDMQAGQIMTPRTDVFALPVDTPWLEACHKVVEGGHSRVPVYVEDLDNIIGVLYAKDLLKYVGMEPPKGLRAAMRKPFFVPETKRLDDLLKEFKARKIHLSIVLDEYGGTAGVVTIEDVLEEIVGEIADEYDRPEPALMHRIDENSAEVDGRMYIDDLNEAMGLKIPEDRDYTTVAGFVFSELGYIPSVGESLTACGGRFDVLAADERKITRLRIQKLLPQGQEAE